MNYRLIVHMFGSIVAAIFLYRFGQSWVVQFAISIGINEQPRALDLQYSII